MMVKRGASARVVRPRAIQDQLVPDVRPDRHIVFLPRFAAVGRRRGQGVVFIGARQGPHQGAPLGWPARARIFRRLLPSGGHIAGLFSDVAGDLGAQERRQLKAAVADQHILRFQEFLGCGNQCLDQTFFLRLGRIDAQQAQGQEQTLLPDLAHPPDDAEHDRRQRFPGLVVVVFARTVLQPWAAKTGGVNRHGTVPAVIADLPLPRTAQGGFPVDQQLADVPAALAEGLPGAAHRPVG